MPLDFASEFRSWVARCKEAMGIAHWEIKIYFLPIVANNPDALGATPDADLAYESAVIVIKDPRHGGHPDWKRTVLHELLHAASGGTLGTRQGSKERDDLERFIERQTRSLYRLLTAGDAPSLDAARMCFRMAKAAREGGGNSMEQLIKMIMELAGDEAFAALPPEAKAKFQAVVTAAAALGSGESAPPSAPEGAALALDPAADPKDKKDDFAMRRAAIDASLKRAAADAAAIEKGAFMARLGHELHLTPDQEKRIAAMPVDVARAYAEGLKDAGAVKPKPVGVSLRQGPADEPRSGPADHADLLVDAKGEKLTGNPLRVRESMIAKYGADAVRRQMQGGA